MEVNGCDSVGITAGVPQVLVRGPARWNILYDYIIGIKLLKYCKKVAYVVDLGLLVEADVFV